MNLLIYRVKEQELDFKPLYKKCVIEICQYYLHTIKIIYQ